MLVWAKKVVAQQSPFQKVQADNLQHTDPVCAHLRAESGTVSVADAAALGVFERKILRKIFGPIRVGAEFRPVPQAV